MKKTILGAAVAALALSLSAPVATAADEGIMKYAINKPSTAWNVYGPGQTNAYVKDKAVVGGGGVRVVVGAPDPAAAWRVSGSQAVNVINRREIQAAADPEVERRRLVDEYVKRLEHPFIAAAKGYVDDVIDPAETRTKIAHALELLRTKSVPVLPKKHGNIPL